MIPSYPERVRNRAALQTQLSDALDRAIDASPLTHAEISRAIGRNIYQILPNKLTLTVLADTLAVLNLSLAELLEA